MTTTEESYKNRFGMAIRAIVEYHKQDLRDRGFDLRFSIDRKPRKHIVVLSLTEEAARSPPTAVDWTNHILGLVKQLSDKGKRVSDFTFGTDDDGHLQSLCLGWEPIRPRRKRHCSSKK